MHVLRSLARSTHAKACSSILDILTEVFSYTPAVEYPPYSMMVIQRSTEYVQINYQYGRINSVLLTVTENP